MQRDGCSLPLPNKEARIPSAAPLRVQPNTLTAGISGFSGIRCEMSDSARV